MIEGQIGVQSCMLGGGGGGGGLSTIVGTKQVRINTQGGKDNMFSVPETEGLNDMF